MASSSSTTAGQQVATAQILRGLQVTTLQVSAGLQVTTAQVVTGLEVTTAQVVTGLQVTTAQVVTGLEVTTAEVVTGLQVTTAQVVTGLQVTTAAVVTGCTVTTADVVTGRHVRRMPASAELSISPTSPRATTPKTIQRFMCYLLLLKPSPYLTLTTYQPANPHLPEGGSVPKYRQEYLLTAPRGQEVELFSLTEQPPHALSLGSETTSKNTTPATTVKRGTKKKCGLGLDRAG